MYFFNLAFYQKFIIMNQLDDIYNLINAMSKTEKRYFRLFANQNKKKGDNNMLDLFDIVSRLKNVPKVKPAIKNLTVTKYQLRKLILRSLRSYHNNSSKEIEIKNIIHNVFLLHKMDLYEQCKKELSKAKKIAIKYELFSSLIEISSWDLKLATEVTDSNKFENVISKIITEQKNYMDLQKNIIEYIGLSNKMFSYFVVHGIARTKEQANSYRKFLDDPLMLEEEKARSFEAKRYYYSTHALYYVATNDAENAYLHYKKVFNLYAKNKHRIPDPIIRYAGLLNNLASTCLETARYKEAEDYLNELNKIGQKYTHLEIRVFEFTMDKNIILKINKNENEDYEAIERMVVDGLKKFKNKINQQYECTTYLNLSMLFFSLEKYTKALYWINLLLNSYNINIRHDAQVKARILNLIIHLELENTALLPYVIRSTYRFFKEKMGLSEIEKIIYKYLNLILKAKNTKNTGIYKMMLDDFLKLKKDPFNIASIENFLILWLLRKTEKISFAEAKRRFTENTQ